MKRILITLLIILILFGGAAIILPAIYKDDIMQIVKKEINKNVDATVDFKDVHLSLFRSFPHFSLGIDELSIVGKGDFDSDTLLSVSRMNTTLDLVSVLKEEPIQVIGMDVNKPDIHIKVLENGKANYDIVEEDDTVSSATTDTTSTSGEMKIVLQKVTINNGNLIYDDATIPYFMEINGIEHELRGDLTQSRTLLQTFTKAEKARVVYDGVEYISNVKLDLDADLEVNFDEMKFTFSDNVLKVNEIGLEADGWFRMLEEGYDMDIAFETRRNRFKPFLSLIPAIYQKDFETVEASGNFEMIGFVRGKYSEEEIPAYHTEMKVSGGAFSYPALPDKIEDINVNLTIDNKTGQIDDVVVDASRFKFAVAGNPFEINFFLETPVSDPYIESEMSGNIDLLNVMRVYPFSPEVDIRGELDVNLQLKGNLSSLEKEQYSKFKALGYISLNSVEYQDQQYKVEVKRGQFNFSPEYVDMTGLDLAVGESDFYANGKLTNVLGYMLKDQTVSGELKVHSQNINVNELMPEYEDTSQENDESKQAMEEGDTIAAGEAVKIPPRVNFVMKVTVDEMTYDKMNIKDLAGKVEVKDRSLTIQNLKMNTLNGEMGMTGSYTTLEDLKPTADFDFDMQKVSVKEVAENFVIIERLAPIVKKSRGDVSVNFNYRSQIQPDMSPDLSTVNANGNFDVEELRFEDVKLLSRLGEMLQIEELDNPGVKNAGISFEIRDGNLYVKPFDMKFNGMKATLGGKTNLNQSIDYQLQIDIPRNKFGKKANKALEDIVGEVSKLGVDFKPGEVIPVKANITGTVTDPKIRTELAGEVSDFKENLKDQVNEEIEKKKEEAKEKIQEKAREIIDKARKQGDKLIAEAEKQAEKIRQNGRKAAKKVREETDKRAQQIRDKAEDKGMLARMAAKEAAKKAKQSGYKKADKLEEEADKKADSVIARAKKEAQKLLEEARKKADKIKE
ncbi:MAG: hypothetical protein K9J27_06680 [Bacteroidales bacterium]|nr:hypothetical protein [Bacteroidales bacterium]MCF8333766.1 hypothetical protein [Bacteroidales bacterium]